MVGGTYAVAWLATLLLGLPPRLGFSPVVRAVGWASVAAGVVVGGWVFRYRNPVVMISSTYATFRKMFHGCQVAEESGRSDPLVVGGPQKYTRNPLYFAVLLVIFGWGLATASTDVLVWSVALLGWFSLVLIPFEEKELQMLFGERFSEYVENVPMLVPFTKRKRLRRSSAASKT